MGSVLWWEGQSLRSSAPDCGFFLPKVSKIKNIIWLKINFLLTAPCILLAQTRYSHSFYKTSFVFTSSELRILSLSCSLPGFHYKALLHQIKRAFFKSLLLPNLQESPLAIGTDGGSINFLHHRRKEEKREDNCITIMFILLLLRPAFPGVLSRVELYYARSFSIWQVSRQLEISC